MAQQLPNCDTCNLKIKVENIEVHLLGYNFVTGGDVQGWPNGGPRSYAEGGGRVNANKPLIKFDYCIEDIVCGQLETDLEVKPFTPVQTEPRGVVLQDGLLSPYAGTPGPNWVSAHQLWFLGLPTHFTQGWSWPLWLIDSDVAPLGAASTGGTYWTKGLAGDQRFTEQVCCGTGRDQYGRPAPLNCCKFMKDSLEECCGGDSGEKKKCCDKIEDEGDPILMPWSDWLDHNTEPMPRDPRTPGWNSWSNRYRRRVLNMLHNALPRHLSDESGKGDMEQTIQDLIDADIRMLFEDCDYNQGGHGWFWPDHEKRIKEYDKWVGDCRCVQTSPGTSTSQSTWNCP